MFDDTSFFENIVVNKKAIRIDIHYKKPQLPIVQIFSDYFGNFATSAEIHDDTRSDIWELAEKTPLLTTLHATSLYGVYQRMIALGINLRNVPYVIYQDLLDNDQGKKFVLYEIVENTEELINFIEHMNPSQIDFKEFIKRNKKRNIKNMLSYPAINKKINSELLLKDLFPQSKNKTDQENEYSVDSLRYVENALNTHEGMIIFASNAGQGKTTNLNAALNTYIKSRPKYSDYKFVTIENHAELKLNQKAYDDHCIINLVSNNILEPLTIDDISDNFGSMTNLIHESLRMRIWALGFHEIREKVEAKALQEAASTGRLVLTTIHSATLSRILSRLYNFEIDLNNVKVIVEQAKYVSSTGEDMYLRSVIPVNDATRPILENYNIDNDSKLMLDSLEEIGIYSIEKVLN